MDEKTKKAIIKILDEIIPKEYYQMWSHLYSNFFNTPQKVFEIFDLYSRELGIGVDDNIIHQRVFIEEDNREFEGYIELYGTIGELKIPAVVFYTLLFDICTEVDKVIKMKEIDLYLFRFKNLIEKYKKQFPV